MSFLNKILSPSTLYMLIMQLDELPHSQSDEDNEGNWDPFASALLACMHRKRRRSLKRKNPKRKKYLIAAVATLGAPLTVRDRCANEHRDREAGVRLLRELADEPFRRMFELISTSCC